MGLWGYGIEMIMVGLEFRDSATVLGLQLRI